MKKILSLILCTLLLLTNVSVFAENVDDFWLYGGDYPSDDGRKSNLETKLYLTILQAIAKALNFYLTAKIGIRTKLYL